MLTKFEVKNFKNFDQNFIFDLSNVKNYEFNKECIKNNIVNKALIYGPNASGKTNLGIAIFDIVTHLTDNHINKSFFKNYLNAATEKGDEVIFRYQFLINGSTVLYEYAKSDYEKLVYEKLYIDGNLLISYDRSSNNTAIVILKGTENLKTDLKETNISIIKYIKSNSILDDTIENLVFLGFIEFVSRMLFFRDLESRDYIGQQMTVKRISEAILEENLLEDFELFLNNAGIPARLKRILLGDTECIAFDYGKKKIEFGQAASTGTLALGYFYYWLQQLNNGLVSFLYLDEFDAYYHNDLSKLIVSEIKKNSCQSILTTHNTSIMTNDLLRPDCYFILKNNSINPIFEFTEKELRKAHNIEKMYKAGTFSG